MYVTTIKSVNYPLALPLDFLDEFMKGSVQQNVMFSPDAVRPQ
jgi:hypothetical protein